jgi:hypothetical protein
LKVASTVRVGSAFEDGAEAHARLSVLLVAQEFQERFEGREFGGKEPRQNKLNIWSETSYATRVAAQSPLEREYGQTDQLISARRLSSLSARDRDRSREVPFTCPNRRSPASATNTDGQVWPVIASARSIRYASERAAAAFREAKRS